MREKILLECEMLEKRLKLLRADKEVDPDNFTLNDFILCVENTLMRLKSALEEE